MTRYQCPFCHSLHCRVELPTCATHTRSYSPRCTTCRQVATQTPCGGAQS